MVQVITKDKTIKVSKGAKLDKTLNELISNKKQFEVRR